ncbi:MAG: hypothetical protein QHJ73_11505, partial [Armatimonadota bacterium]|nr:hypothetical protein [Armatimonadota bacterium]
GEGDNPRLEEHQQRHLLSCYLEITGLMDEMERIARTGRAAWTSGALLTPLPPEWWRRIAAPLEGARQRLRAMVDREAPEQLQTHAAQQPLSASLRWLSLLLLRLGEEVENLGPSRFQRQYGPMPKALASEFAALQRELKEALAAARAELEHPPGE